MSTAPSEPTRCKPSRWQLPLFSVGLGLIMLAAFWLGGHVGDGLGALAVMSALGLLFLLGGRSETIRGLRGDGRDERFAMIDLTATAVAGFAVIIAVIAGFLVEVAEGHNGSPYDWLGAIGGLAYMLAIGVLRWRT